MAKKKDLRERLLEALQADEDEDNGGGEEEDDMIVLRGPSARALLGLLGGDDGKPDSDGKPDGGDDPPPEPGPQRSQSRYFGDK